MKEALQSVRAALGFSLAGLLGCILNVGLLTWAAPALAGSFTVTPVRVFMGPKDRVVAMTVVNEGDERLVLQTELLAWSQAPDGQEQLADSSDLLVAPPIISVPPKARQVIRLAVTQPAAGARQRTYRLFVREIVEANLRPKDNEVAIPIALTLSLPVFITPPGAERRVDCQQRLEAEQVMVTCANSGSAYAQLRRVVVLSEGREVGRFEGALYILPGARREAAIKPGAPLPGGPMQIQVTYDDDKEQRFEAAGR